MGDMAINRKEGLSPLFPRSLEVVYSGSVARSQSMVSSIFVARSIFMVFSIKVARSSPLGYS